MPTLEPTGHLQLVGEIARGGMGAILKGRDVDLGRDLAVKVLLETHVGRTELVQRFVEEAQIAGQLQHPGITPVYELGLFSDRRPYFTMKLVKGQTLAALLHRRTDPAEDRPRYLGIFGQVCQTLAYAHARGVIHRDLKPSNVMVGAFGEVQVMDWGLAKVLREGGVADEEKASRGRQPPEAVSVIRTQRSSGTPETGSPTLAGSVLGTPAYMAPEQARGDVDLVDERADVFGLGAILCEILTGQPPFTGKPAEAMRQAQTGRLVVALARLDGCGADGELIGLARRCLAAEPWDRPRHAGEVAAALTAYQEAVAERLRQTELAHAAEVARTEEAQATLAQERRAREAAQARAVAERRSRHLTLALAASVLLTVLAGGGGWLWLRSERQARAERLQRDVDLAVTESTALRERARTARGREASALAAQAREQAQRAQALLEGGPAEAALSERVRGLLTDLDAEEKDRQLVEAIDAARLAQADTNVTESRFMREKALPLFREAFRVYGIAVGHDDAGAVAERLAACPPGVRDAAMSALDEWVVLGQDPRWEREPHVEWLRQVLTAVEPAGWGREVRDAAAEKDPVKKKAALEKLAESADIDHLPAQALRMLVTRLQAVKSHAAAVALLRRAWRRHSDDFWINEDLGLGLQSQKPPDAAGAVRYLSAAVALRPDTSGARLNLGNSLWAQGKRDEAIVEYRTALELDPQYARTLRQLGLALSTEHTLDEAIAALRKSIDLDAKDAEAHRGLGVALEKNQQFEEAIREFRTAVELDPSNANARFNLGNALLDKEQLEAAKREYRKAIDLDPKDARPHSNLSKVFLDLKEFDSAIEECRKAIALDPTFAVPHNNLGIALAAKQQLDAAIEEYRKAINLEPKLASAHSNLGNALRLKHKLDEAVSEHHTAIALDSKSAMAYHNFGVTLHDQGQLDAAIDEYRKAIALGSKNARLHNDLGDALREKLSLDAAVDEYQKALDLDPKDSYPHVGLGLVLTAKQQPDAAIQEYHQAIALNPRSAVAYHNLAGALISKQELNLALQACLKAVEIDSKNATAHNNLGAVLQRLKRLDEAEGEYRKAVELSPENVMFCTNLAIALRDLKRPLEADAMFRQAIRLKPDDAANHHSLAVLLGNQRRYQDARPFFETVTRLKPDFAQAHSSLSFCLWNLGHFKEAESACREAIRLKPDSAEAHGYFGMALASQGRYKEAEVSCREAIRLGPNDARWHSNLAFVLIEQRTFPDAETYSRNAIKIDPKLFMAHFNLGKALRGRGELKEAEQVFREAIRLNPNYADTHYQLGLCMVPARERAKEAEASYREAIRIKPDYAEAHCNLGHALLGQGRFTEALDSIRHGHELGSRRPNWPYPSGQWVRLAENLVQLDCKLEAVFKGEVHPAGNAVRLAFAKVCLDYKRLTLAALRFYEDALAADPTLFDDLHTFSRYNAACAAALTACGQGRDTEKPVETELATIRNKSLAWLRADLAAWTKFADNPKEHARIRQTLQHWQQDTDLASIRDPNEIAKLPADEQEAWKKLWAEVAELLKMVKEKPK
jgi:serine/threonine-protein kinase